MANSNSPHGIPMYIWMGQIVDEKNWTGNEPKTIHAKDEIPGWGKRYKVRILGRDTQVKDVPDDQLEMADILLPVTAGSGLAGSKQTANLRQGDYVVGFYKDGLEGNQPCILGCLPNNAQTALFPGDPPTAYAPRSGYVGLEGQKPISTKDIWKAASGGGVPAAEAGSVSSSKQATTEKQDQAVQGEKSYTLSKPYICDGPTSAISKTQLELKKAIATVNVIKGQAAQYSDLENSVGSILQNAGGFIQTYMKLHTDYIRGSVLKEVNKQLQPIYDKLSPNKLVNFGKKMDGLQEALNCAFQNIMGKLGPLISSLLNSLVDQFINAPLCAISTFLAGLLSSMLGPITSALAAFGGLLGNIGGILGSVFNILDMVTGVLNLFVCESPVKCEMNPEWNIWDGGQKFAAALPAKMSKIIADRAAELGNPNPPPCPSAPLPCGPPTLSFGGSGSGATGNAIIGECGGIIGVDMTAFGSGYSSSASIQIGQACGNGSGAVLKPVVGTPPETQGGVFNGQITSTDGNNVSGTFNGVTDKGIEIRGRFRGTSNEDGVDGDFEGESDNCNRIEGTFRANTRQGSRLRGLLTARFRCDNNAGIGTTSAGIGTTSGGAITKVIVVDPGVGYLPKPNGEVGGEGSKLAGKCDTLIYDLDNKYELYKPDDVVGIQSGYQISLPLGTSIQILSPEGDYVEEIRGRGLTEKIVVNSTGTFTCPKCPDIPENIPDNPTSSDGSYPVILAIESVEILNPGFNYSGNEEITITPDKGAKLKPTFGKNGEVARVDVINGGLGFTDIPRLSIVSQTGINAVLQPVFTVIRVADIPDGLDSIPQGTEVLTVKQCF